MTYSSLHNWDYDEFEQHLLDSVKGDSAPADLPLRVGLALGISGSMLTAASAGVSVASISGVSAKTVASTAIATAKTSTTFGVAALWATAAKGIAVGLIAGGMALTAGHAAIAGNSESAEPTAFAGKQTQSQRAAKRGAARLIAPPGIAAETPHPNAPERIVERSALRPLAASNRLASVIGEAPRSAVHESGATAVKDRRENDPSMPGEPGHTRPDDPSIVREPTPTADASVSRSIGIAAFDALPEDRQAADSVGTQAPVVELSQELTAEDYAQLRARTIARARAALGRHQSQAALEELHRYQKVVGAKRFGIEELLLRIEALVGVGKRKEARADATRVERFAPNSKDARLAQQLANSRDVR